MMTCEKNYGWIHSRLSELLTGKSFSLLNARMIFKMLFKEKLPFHQAKTLLLLMAAKGETSEELLGCLKALQQIEKPIRFKIPSLMDTCGTGGDSRCTINISTLAAIVIAGSGGKVAKHGNRAVTSKSGSSDLLESFGINLDASQKKMIRAIQTCGLGYFHAPSHHPVFSKMQPLRRSLKRRTILNLLGPLVNPMKLDYQLVGVAENRLIPLYAKVLARLGHKTALVCHSKDGMDEISTSAPTIVARIKSNHISYDKIRPEKYGLRRASLKDIRVNSVKESKRIAEKILTGKERGAARDMIVLNAAFGLWVCQKVRTVGDGIKLAQKAIDSGSALRVLSKLRKISNQ